MPEAPAGPARVAVWRRVWRPAIGVALLAGILFGLHRALAKIGVADVLGAIAATPLAQLAHAGLLTCVSLGIMAVYDVPGILFGRRLAGFPRLGAGRIALASGCAYALSHVLGAPALTAAAIRVRFYARWRVPAAGIARIVALSGVMFTLGAGALLGGILLLRPGDVPLFGGAAPAAALRALGAGLWLAVLGYVAAAGAKTPLTILGRAIPRPGPALAVAQILISCADTGCAAAILYTALPNVAGLSYAHVLGIYLAAFAGGLVSALPGGVGVFDSLLLLGLAGQVDAAPAIGAILLFRLIYYVFPAVLGAGAFCSLELWAGFRGRG